MWGCNIQHTWLHDRLKCTTPDSMHTAVCLHPTRRPTSIYSTTVQRHTAQLSAPCSSTSATHSNWCQGAASKLLSARVVPAPHRSLRLASIPCKLVDTAGRVCRSLKASGTVQYSTAQHSTPGPAPLITPGQGVQATPPLSRLQQLLQAHTMQAAQHGRDVPAGP